MATVPQSPAPCKQAAKFYVKDLSLAVVPLNGKIPNAKKWEDGHICTLPQIESIFKDHHNVGIVTGRYAHDDQPNLTRVWVLDVDWKEETILPDDAPEGTKPERVAPTWGEDGRPLRTEGTNLVKNGYVALDAMMKEHGDLPPTWVVRTGGGGTHYYFTIPQGVSISGTAGLRPHIDVRADRGQCAAPPSIHPETQQEYAWYCTGDHIADTPAWLLDIVTEKDRKNAERAETARKLAEDRKAKAAAAGFRDAAAPAKDRNYALLCLTRAAGDVRDAAEGERHDKLFKKTLYIRKVYGGRGTITDEEIEAAMTEAGLACGLPEYEVESTVNSAMVKGEEQQDSAYDPIPNPPSPADRAIMNFMQNISSNSTSNGGTPPPPPPPPSGGGNGGGGTPPPPPPPPQTPPPAAAPAGQNVPLPTSRNPAYPMDANTFRNLRRRPDTFSNGVITRWGQPKGILANVLKVFELDPSWTQKFWYNELDEAEFINRGLGNSSAMKDSDYIDIVGILNDQYNLEVSVENVANAVKVAAARNAINPVCVYLAEVAPKWDNVPRLDTWLQDYMGAEDTQLYRKMGARWMIAAVARAFEPGCKVDHMLIIQGPQNAGKSTAFKTLASAGWFSSTGLNLDNEKDACEKLRGVWLYEIAELSAFTAGKADANKLKAFITNQVDRYRRSYDRTAAAYPRRSVFCGTTNKTQFLNDSTGSRRFWIVPSGPAVNIPGLAAARDQLWAEAVHRYLAHEEYWLDRTEETERAETAVDYGADDPYVNWMTGFCDHRDNFSALDFWQSLPGNNERTMSNGDAKRISDLVETVGTHKPGRYYQPTPGNTKGVRQRGYILKAPRPPKPGPFKP